MRSIVTVIYLTLGCVSLCRESRDAMATLPPTLFGNLNASQYSAYEVSTRRSSPAREFRHRMIETDTATIISHYADEETP